MFAKFGLPETIVTDNGTGFTSQEFRFFLRQNGISHVTSAPYHPASNVLTERAVQIVEQGLRKVATGSINTRLARIVLSYRITPQSTTGVSPAELLLGRRPRTRLDIIRPNTAERVEKKQMQQKFSHDKSARSRKFVAGNRVFAKNFGTGHRWLPGKIISRAGPVSYRVRLVDGRVCRCHLDQLRSQPMEEEAAEQPEVGCEDNSSELFPPPAADTGTVMPAVGGNAREPPVAVDVSHQSELPNAESNISPTVLTHDRSNVQPVPRYPRRHRTPREVFDPGVH